MKNVLVFRHDSHETLGTLEPFLKSCELKIQYCDLFSSNPVPKDPQPYQLIISMGGPMNADETERYPFLAKERAFLKIAIDQNKSVVGICLGSQIIARALEARVYRGSEKEIGWHSITLSKSGITDPIFSIFDGAKPDVFHWHGDTFDLPKGAVHLASSNLYQNQAFRYKQNVYAMQFHVEITPEMVSQWADENKKELEAVKPACSTESLKQETKKYMDSLERITDKMYPALYSNLVGSED